VLNRALGAEKYDEALNAAEHLVRYDPLNAQPYVTLGLVAYLAGKQEQSLSAFNRAKGLTLPNQFMTLWNNATAQGGARGGRGGGGGGGSRYQKVLDDKAFVSKILGS
jgi:hypothetical protein